MEPFKGTIVAFCGIVITMARKNAELYPDVEAAKRELAAAKVVADSALKKAKDSDNRAEKAEKAEKATAMKNADLYQDVEVVKKDVAAAKVVVGECTEKS